MTHTKREHCLKHSIWLPKPTPESCRYRGFCRHASLARAENNISYCPLICWRIKGGISTMQRLQAYDAGTSVCKETSDLRGMKLGQRSSIISLACKTHLTVFKDETHTMALWLGHNSARLGKPSWLAVLGEVFLFNGQQLSSLHCSHACSGWIITSSREEHKKR